MRELDAPEQRASPRGETFPLHQVPAKRDQAASDTESAPICTGLPGTHKASCALPRCTAAGGSLQTRLKRGAHKRARCGASGDTGQRGELSSPICGTAAARICRDGAYRLMKARFRGTRQRAIRRRRLHRLSRSHRLRPPTMWSERRYPLVKNKGPVLRAFYDYLQDKSQQNNRSFSEIPYTIENATRETVIIKPLSPLSGLAGSGTACHWYQSPNKSISRCFHAA